MTGAVPTQPRRRRAAVAIAAGACAVVATLVLVLVLSGGEEAARPPARPSPFFARSSFWNARLPARAALDPASNRLVGALAREIERERAAGIGPWIQTDEASTPLYTVGPRQPKVHVTLDTGPWRRPLERALRSGVPIPAGARPAAGPDRHITIYQPATDRLWELWRASRRADGWHAEWGGAMRHVSRSQGYFTQHGWGATATSLPVIGGTMLIRELRSGRIEHALALDVPDARAGRFAWPAQRTDGGAGPDALPEGARLRLDPKLDVGSLGLDPAARAMAEAAQRYGVVVRDRTHHAVAFFGEDPTPTGDDPYPELFGGVVPSQVLEHFPWSRLQLLKMSVCTRAPCPRRDSP